MATSTQCVWGGDVQPAFDGSLVFPLCDSVTNGDKYYRDLKKRALFDPMKKPHGSVIHGYGRNTNSSTKHVRDKILVIEQGDPLKHAVTDFNCGMSAIYCVLKVLTKPGDRIVSIKDTYGGTSKLLLDEFPNEGREVMLCETLDGDQIEAETLKGCRLLYLETPTNPTLKIIDLERMSRAAQKVGAIMVVDNTFASPVNQNPLELGADLVIHSATKYINGHGHAMGGFVIGDKELVRQIYAFKEIQGSGMSPDIAHKISIGMKTLALRIQQHNQNAMAIAKLCREHPLVEAVYYPGLPDHPNHEVAKRQMKKGFGGMLSFELKGGEYIMAYFLDCLLYRHLAASLGHVETLVGPPSATSHVECTPEERAKLGISETLVRYSTGIEETEDLVADVKNALDLAYQEWQLRRS